MRSETQFNGIVNTLWHFVGTVRYTLSRLRTRCKIGVSIIKNRIEEAQCVSPILFYDALHGIQLPLWRDALWQTTFLFV